jgi:hypothetical protein
MGLWRRAGKWFREIRADAVQVVAETTKYIAHCQSLEEFVRSRANSL